MGKNTIDWTLLLTTLERLVVASDHGLVKKALSEINFRQVPRVHTVSLAEISWRISEPLLALKVLNRVLFPKNELSTQATTREKFVYATALSYLGASREAFSILESIDTKKEPEVLLRKALALFSEWRYADAIPLLHDFHQRTDVAPYRSLIGKVNLAAALIVEKHFDEASLLLTEIQSLCEIGGYALLSGNAFEMQAQIAFFKGDYARALANLENSKSRLKNQGGQFALFAEKWTVLSYAFRDRTPAGLLELRKFKQKAFALRQWETVRECDLFESALQQDIHLAKTLVLGTPFESYRRRIRNFVGKKMLANGRGELHLGTEFQDRQTFIFDPYSVQQGGASLHTQRRLLALYDALTNDFYKPSHVGLLFERIYSDEKFNPFSSPKRVLSLIHRLNSWFRTQQVPLRVQLKKSEFRLQSDGDQHVIAKVQRGQRLSKEAGGVSLLRDHFKQRTFSSQKVAVALNISKTSAQNLIAHGLRQQVIIQLGNGRSTRYAWNSKKRSAA